MKVKNMLLGAIAVAAVASLRADTLYWQVAPSDSVGEFTYATLYARDASDNDHAITSILADGVSDPERDHGTKVSPVITDLGGYGSSSYSFWVELTNYTTGNTSSPNQDYPWSYTELVNSGYISTGNSVAMPVSFASGAALNGGAVPEPTSGLLLLIGGSLLALRRRRQA